MPETEQITIQDLDKLYRDGESVDNNLFSELRSNVLLVSGDHYLKSHSKFFQRIRSSRGIDDRQKLRLTKNHVQRITKSYCNIIISSDPGVGFTPFNESELSDQKTAEMHKAVWQDAVIRYDIDEKKEFWCDDFVQLGECVTKIFFNPKLGKVKAFEQKLDADGQPKFKEELKIDPATGVPGVLRTPEADFDKPVHEGEMVFERVHAFNLIRAASAETMDDSPWLAIRKMSEIADLKKQFEDDPQKLAMIESSSEHTFKVFDGITGDFKDSQDQMMVIEYYYRPSPRFPKGKFFITAHRGGILEQGDLPGGIFPLIWQAYENIQTTPRGRSPIKTMRPYQAEINRSASKIAEHQITLGDDKLLIQNGTKISAGVSLAGIRSINHTGAPPQILPGRDGLQHFPYMQAQITELYEVMELKERDDPKDFKGDAFASLFMAASKKKKFQRHIRKFERFLVNVAKTYLKLAKFHFTEDRLVRVLGKSESVNMAEFKDATDEGFQVKAEPQADDIEEKMGKQLVLNNALQFVGSSLDKQDIGKLMRTMPMANLEESFKDFTIDSDTADNVLLALDRGETPQVNKFDEHIYMIKRLVLRMRQADFRNVSPEIQQNYQAMMAQHQEAETQNQISIQRAQQGFIPTDGPLVTVDFYVRDPKDPLKTRRAKLPHNAIQWLVGQLESQGQGQQALEDLNEGALAQLSDRVSQQAGGGQLPGQAQAPSGVQNGNGNANPFAALL